MPLSTSRQSAGRASAPASPLRLASGTGRHAGDAAAPVAPSWLKPRVSPQRLGRCSDGRGPVPQPSSQSVKEAGLLPSDGSPGGAQATPLPPVAVDPCGQKSCEAPPVPGSAGRQAAPSFKNFARTAVCASTAVVSPVSASTTTQARTGCADCWARPAWANRHAAPYRHLPTASKAHGMPQEPAGRWLGPLAPSGLPASTCRRPLPCATLASGGTAATPASGWPLGPGQRVDPLVVERRDRVPQPPEDVPGPLPVRRARRGAGCHFAGVRRHLQPLVLDVRCPGRGAQDPRRRRLRRRAPTVVTRAAAVAASVSAARTPRGNGCCPAAPAVLAIASGAGAGTAAAAPSRVAAQRAA